MAHGRKKWVYAIDVPGGRVKRSRHKTSDDKLGRLTRATEFHKTDRWKEMVWLSHAPKYYRRLLHQKYRGRVRHLMINARYDELPRSPRDAAWTYW